jgi:type II secretory pathway predicted ATPase ExeA
LFFDLVKDKNFKVPSQAEQRERKLLELVKKQDKPIVLFIDEAHDLSGQTLISLKRLIELVYSSEGKLTVI